MPRRPTPLRAALLGALALLATALTACTDRADAEPDADARPVRIVVSIPPLAGLIHELAPEAQVTLLVPPGVSEHNFDITAAAIAATGAADLVVLNGAGLEPQVERLLKSQGERKGRSVIRFGDVVGVTNDGHDHQDGHDHDHDHDHGAIDPHLWLDPVLVERFTPALSQALMSAMLRADDQNGMKSLEARTAHLLTRVRAVDQEYREQLKPFTGRSIVTQHAAFGRLADRYGLQVAATLRAGDMVEPTPAVIAQVARLAREQGVKAVFTEPQSSGMDARRLSEATGLKLLVLDPLGTGNWEELMLTNLESLVEGLE